MTGHKKLHAESVCMAMPSSKVQHTVVTKNIYNQYLSV
jgi:hypothetical protein